MNRYIYPWSKGEAKLLLKFKSPEDIQFFLNKAKYNKGSRALMPGEVLREKKANCFDGALFAACALDYLGMPPILMDLRAVRDDDHVLAIFRKNGCIGAIAKSNYTGLRYREPIYKNARELAVSYFNDYFNLQRERTLREYSELYHLKDHLKPDWHLNPDFFYEFAFTMDELKHWPVLTPKQVKTLGIVDLRTFRAGKLGRQ